MFKIKTLTKPETLSDIGRDIAQIFFATFVVSQFLEKDASALVVLYGLFTSLGFWIISLRLAKN
jgi:hypothetical protein